MCISNLLSAMPGWYLWAMILLSAYYAFRGVKEKMLGNALQNSKTPKSLFYCIVVDYIQEALFKVIFTVSGFIALFAANHICSLVNPVKDMSAGTAVIVVFLFVWGITGVSGYLTFLVITGKYPGSGN